jgi:putative membrane protein
VGERTFFEDGARKRVVAAVKEIEAQTSAEVVVAVRNAAGAYRDVDYLVGSGAAFAALLVLLFHPYPFATEGMPLEVIAAFAVGAALSANVRPVRRWLTSRKRRETSARDAARASFVGQGIGRTKDRNGILVLVALLERRVAVVADVGIDPAKLGAEWGKRVSELEASLEGDARIDRFLPALLALGPVLAAQMPRQADDVNELPDEVAD